MSLTSDESDNALWLDEKDPSPQLHPNTYHPDLHTFLHHLNTRRLSPGMTVDIIGQRNHVPVATGVVKEVIPHEQFSGDTGQFHDAVIAVRREDGRVEYYSPDRVVPSATNHFIGYDPDVVHHFSIHRDGPDHEVEVPHNKKNQCDD